MGFGLKNKQVNFSGLQNIAVHVTVNLATLCVEWTTDYTALLLLLYTTHSMESSVYENLGLEYYNLSTSGNGYTWLIPAHTEGTQVWKEDWT